MLRTKYFCRLLCLVLACSLLGGCALLPGLEPNITVPTEPAETTVSTEPTEATEPAPTAPADGDPNNVSALGSYTGAVTPGAVVATAGESSLTASQLQLYYGLMVSSWREAASQPAPDWDQPLDVQLCPLDGDAVTWQQFFLQQALDAWHLHTALIQHSTTAHMKLDPEYKPYQIHHDTYLKDDMPALEYLYGRNTAYELNELNAAFMEELPDLLTALGGADSIATALGGASVNGKLLLTVAQQINEAYAYFIWARKQSMPLPMDEEVLAGDTVTFRHVLLIPEDGDWDACEKKANDLLTAYKRDRLPDEARFGAMANKNSADEGSRLNGGLYEYVAQGQMTEALDTWLFDSARTAGEIAILRSDLGVHIVYYCGMFAAPDHSSYSEALIDEVLSLCPMTVDYTGIRLEKAPDEGSVTLTQLLYPDVAHEFITDYPLYFQQDFPESMYGKYPLATWGCGITTLSMLASYMCDEWLTPPVLAREYGDYCYSTGTDANLIADAAPELGYYVYWMGYQWTTSRDYMEQGYETICVQHKGYFTSGGHYLILREQYEDGTLSIRDSNIFNYGKLHPHADDHFKWSHVYPAGGMYWSFEPKITRIPACERCGGETGLAAPEGLLLTGYTCERCLDATARMNDFLYR